MYLVAVSGAVIDCIVLNRRFCFLIILLCDFSYFARALTVLKIFLFICEVYVWYRVIRWRLLRLRFQFVVGIWNYVGSVRYSFCVPDFIFQSMTISQTCRHKAHLANFVNFFYFFINFLTACCCSMLDFSSVSLRVMFHKYVKQIGYRSL